MMSFWSMSDAFLKGLLLLLLLLLAVCYDELYAFSYNPKQNDQQREEGWQLIDLAAEFERMGVPCDQWQLTDVNREYKVGLKKRRKLLNVCDPAYNIQKILILVGTFVSSGLILHVMLQSYQFRESTHTHTKKNHKSLIVSHCVPFLNMQTRRLD